MDMCSSMWTVQCAAVDDCYMSGARLYDFKLIPSATTAAVESSGDLTLKTECAAAALSANFHATTKHFCTDDQTFMPSTTNEPITVAPTIPSKSQYTLARHKHSDGDADPSDVDNEIMMSCVGNEFDEIQLENLKDDDIENELANVLYYDAEIDDRDQQYLLHFGGEPDEATNAKISVDDALQMFADDVNVAASSAKQQNSALCSENLRQNLKLLQTMARTEDSTTINMRAHGSHSIPSLHSHPQLDAAVTKMDLLHRELSGASRTANTLKIENTRKYHQLKARHVAMTPLQRAAFTGAEGVTESDTAGESRSKGRRQSSNGTSTAAMTKAAKHGTKSKFESS